MALCKGEGFQKQKTGGHARGPNLNDEDRKVSKEEFTDKALFLCLDSLILACDACFKLIFPLLYLLLCSTDALDALGGVEDLTMGMNPFPSSNDLIDLAGGQMDGHLNLGMGDQDFEL